MAGISNYARRQILLKYFGQTGAAAIPGTWYIALCKTVPTAVDTGISITEPSSAEYASYARVAVTNDTTHWNQTAGLEGRNLTTDTFPTSGGGASSPVSLPGACLCDALATGTGNMWFFGTLSQVIAVSTGQAPPFNPGDLAFSLS